MDINQNPTDWDEKTTQGGKVYFINKKTNETSWEVPSDLQEWKNKLAAYQLQLKLLEKLDNEDCEEGQITEEGLAKDVELSKRDDVRAIYLQMFQEAGVSATWKWEDFHRIMKHDDRFNIIKAVGQKKQIFLEHLQNLKKKDREDGKHRKQAARENFQKMLESSGILRADSKYYKTAHYFQGDPRWRILEEREREDLYQDFLDELERKDKEKQKQQRNHQMQVLRKILEDNHEIDHRTKWYQVQKMLSENEHFKSLHKLDQLTVFTDFVTEFEKNSQESKKLDEKTKARKNRENYKKMLENLMKTGTLTPISHWNEIYPKIQDDPAYLSLVGQSGSTPKEIFDDVIQEEKIKYKDYKENLLIALANFEFSDRTTYDEVYQVAKEVLDSIPDTLKQLVYKIVLDEQLTELKNKERKIRKHKKAFQEFLKTNSVVASSKNFDEIRQEIQFKIKNFKRLSEEWMISAFELYLRESREYDKDSEIEPGEIESVTGKREKKNKREKKEKKHKKHKKHRSHEKSHKKKHKHRSRSPVKFI